MQQSEQNEDSFTWLVTRMEYFGSNLVGSINNVAKVKGCWRQLLPTLCCPALFTCQDWWITFSPLCFPFFVLFSSVWISSNSTQFHLTLVFWPVLLQDLNARLTPISARSLWHNSCTRPITKLVPELFVLLLLLMLLLSASYVQDYSSTSLL